MLNFIAQMPLQLIQLTFYIALSSLVIMKIAIVLTDFNINHNEPSFCEVYYSGETFDIKNPKETSTGNIIGKQR